MVSLIFLKEKTKWIHKVTYMCRGQKTVGDDKKEDAASHTYFIESVFITVAVDANEGQDVAKFDIPGAYINTETY